MKKIFFLATMLCAILYAHGQDTTGLIIKEIATNKPIAGATINFSGIKDIFISNDEGSIDIKGIPPGQYIISISHTGYETKTDTIVLPLSSNEKFVISMVQETEDLEELVVQSVRTSRSINNVSTRVEIIDAEEIAEKANMRPANVAMLLHESTGLQVQQTSATSGNASIRVQGLDGRYTQLLKDGYPNFGNFASGLSILEIPPLDLAQVEIIKGPASTLYGGGAIAGVINFISKKPKEKAAYGAIINQSNVGQTNIGGYASQKFKKFGYSFLGLVNFQKAYDVDKDDFSELPKSNSFTIDPKIYFYPGNKATIMLGNSFTKANNRGGDMQVIKGNTGLNHVYFEENNTTRNTTTLEYDQKLRGKNNFRIKQSVSLFDREINSPGYTFDGINTNSFTEISLAIQEKNHQLNAGLNIIYDKFKQHGVSTIINQNCKTFTGGLYVQDTWDVTKRVIIEAGIRVDNAKYTNDLFSKSQSFILPRISTLFKLSDKVSSRIGAGLGYKMPTLFTEQTESAQYKNILPLQNVKSERSIGATADINFKTKINPHLLFSINQLFFYTVINKPLVLAQNPYFNYYFYNASKPVRSTGFETNLKFIFRNNLKLFAGYTFTYAKATYLTGNSFLTLLPRNKINLALVYEKEDNFKIGLEGYFTDKQYLSNAHQTASYWEFGFMAEKTFKKISLFINFENFTDERQSRYKRVVNEPHDNPTFDDIWNHTEGFIVNGGIKLKW